MTSFANAKEWIGKPSAIMLAAMMFAFVPGCSDDETGTGGTGGSGGSGGTGGSAGSAGAGGGGTGGMPATFELSFSGTGYQTPHDGQTMWFALYDNADLTTPVDTTSVTIDADPLVASWPDALTGGQSYTLYYYADINGNDMCDDPGDHFWSMQTGEVTANVEITDSHDIDFDGDCSKHPPSE